LENFGPSPAEGSLTVYQITELKRMLTALIQKLKADR